MAKSRMTYIVEEEVDRKIEVIAALERKSKSDVIEEALKRHIDGKDLVKLLSTSVTSVAPVPPTKPRARAAAVGGRSK